MKAWLRKASYDTVRKRMEDVKLNSVHVKMDDSLMHHFASTYPES